MSKKDKIVNAGGINGLGNSLVNTNSKEFRHLQAMIVGLSTDQSEQERMENGLLAIRFQMEAYLNTPDTSKIPAGHFLEMHLEILGIQKKFFSEYVGYDQSNLSAILKGRRKINPDMALKLGNIFGMNPALWLHIESKNELLKEMREGSGSYTEYHLKDLLKKAS